MIDVVVTDLVVEPRAVGTLGLLLSDAERARACRFASDRDARRFVVARARLRQLLGRRLAVAAGSVELARGAHGKPRLARDRDATLRFNASRSGDVAVYAFASGREVGVDVESIRANPDAEGIVARWFTPREQAAYRALDHTRKPLAFLACWTRKEAVVKALGEGLSCPLDRVEAGLAAGGPVRAGGHSWSVKTFFPAPGYVAAVAVGVSAGPQSLRPADGES